ncbi:MAG: FliG C-terminal domain-containing protein [Elusimicrobiota bacterium]
MMKISRYIVFTFICLTTLAVNPLYAPPVNDSQDLEIIRRESAIAESIQVQIEDMLSKYYKKSTYIVSVKANIARVIPRTETPQPAKQEAPQVEDLPGLPMQAAPVVPKQPAEPVSQESILMDRYRIQYLEVTVLVDEKVFNDQDKAFVETLVKNQTGFDIIRGDRLTIKKMLFPEVQTGETAVEKKERERSEMWQNMFPYIITFAIFAGFVLLMVVVMQVLNFMKPKPIPQQEYPGGYYNPRITIDPQQNLSQGNEPNIHVPSLSRGGFNELMPSSEVNVFPDKSSFNELKRLMITTIESNPKLSSEIFTGWVNYDEEKGVVDIATFLKAVNPREVKVLASYMPNDILAKVDQKAPQVTSYEEQEVITLFKKFYEEFHKTQAVNTAEGAEVAGGTGDAQQREENSSFFDFLKPLNPHQIFHIVREEPVSVIALILAQLTPDIAAGLLNELPDNIRVQVPLEMGKIRNLPISAYRETAAKLAQKAIEVEKLRNVTLDGVEALINILEQSSPDMEQQILDTITAQDSAMAEKLRKVYVSFDKLPQLPDRTLSNLVNDIDREILIKSLTSASEGVKEKVLINLPGRARIIVSDGIKRAEEDGLSVDEIYRARRVVTSKIRELVKAGKIDIGN